MKVCLEEEDIVKSVFVGWRIVLKMMRDRVGRV